MHSYESRHSESNFYYQEEEALNQMTPINLFANFKKKTKKNMFFFLGLTLGTVFFHTDLLPSK